MGAAALVVGSAVGCTPAEEKVKKIFEAGVAECKSQGKDPLFGEVELFTSEDPALVLRESCEQPMQELVKVDEFHITAKIGPYEWISGIDDESGAWVLSGVTWATMDRLERTIKSDEIDAKTLEQSRGDFDKAVEEFPSSSWVRLRRFDNLLRLRKKTRKRGDAGAGEDANKALEELVKWAGEQSKPDAAAEAQVAMLKHLRQHKNVYQDSLEGLGTNDDRFRTTIEQAQKDLKAAKKARDKEAAEAAQKTIDDYSADLEKMLAERPEKEAQFQKWIEASTAELCKQLGLVKTDGVENAELKEQLTAMKSSTKCE